MENKKLRCADCKWCNHYDRLAIYCDHHSMGEIPREDFEIDEKDYGPCPYYRKEDY